MAEKTAKQLLAVIRSIEWSGFQQGQGSGDMSSGGDGPMIRSCPACKGIDPSDEGKNHFVSSVHGHRRGCKIADALSK